MIVHTVTYHPGQHFAKEMEVDEVVWVDRGAWTGPEETIHTLEQSILWIDELQTEEVEKLSEIRRKNAQFYETVLKTHCNARYRY